MKIPDEIWSVFLDTAFKYDGVEYSEDERKKLEEILEVTCFDGGAFVHIGNDFDLFVVPEKRGKWRIREEVTKFLEGLHKKHKTVICGIDSRNKKSLRLAFHFGFKVIGENGTKLRLEKSWAT